MYDMRKALIVVNLAGFLTFLWNDIRLLQDLGYEVSIAMNGKMAEGSDAVEICRLDRMHITHYQIDFDTKNPFTKKNIVAYKQLKQVLLQGFEFVHCHTPIAGLLTRMAARKYRYTGTKVIYTTHGFAFYDKSSTKTWIVYYPVEKIASTLTDAIITINHEDYANAKKMHCKNVFLISSVGLDTKKIVETVVDRDSYRNLIGVKADDIMLLAVGELSPRKNHQVIIRALGQMKNKGKYVFVICGREVANSGMADFLQKLAKENGIRLVLAGHRLDIPQINHCADIAVIPSIREGLGMAGLEALASGVPVVGSDVQGIREYVEIGKTGYLCDPESTQSFADAIEKMVAMGQTEKEIMKNECVKMAYRFDQSVSCAQMKSIYQKICK